MYLSNRTVLKLPSGTIPPVGGNSKLSLKNGKFIYYKSNSSMKLTVVFCLLDNAKQINVGVVKSKIKTDVSSSSSNPN